MPKSRRHILFVEEHRDIRTAFVGLFENIYDYALHVATEARDAMGITGRQSVDVAVVDLAHGMEQGARLAMIRAWRRDGLGFPVIATSPHDDDGLILEAFDAGGDDFLRKPYLFSELRARIQRQLARYLNPMSKITRIDGMALPEESFVFAGATVSPDLRITFPDGRVSKLSPKHVGMLREFSLHAGTLLSKEKLLHAVWGADANTNSTSVHQYLHVLRKLYRASNVDLNAFVSPESKVGWHIANRAAGSDDL
jgi:DNA-binding response OmpR family regulator